MPHLVGLGDQVHASFHLNFLPLAEGFADDPKRVGRSNREPRNTKEPLTRPGLTLL